MSDYNCYTRKNRNAFICTVSGDKSFYTNTFNSLIPSDIKQKLLSEANVYLTVKWSPLYKATFIDNGERNRTETVQFNKFVSETQLTLFKYFSNTGGTEASWYKNAGTLFAGIIETNGTVRIILDECCGYQSTYYHGTYEPDNLYYIKISFIPPMCVPSYRCYKQFSFSRLAFIIIMI